MTNRIETRISVHKKALDRLQNMANNSDLFKETNRPEVYASRSVELNDCMVGVPVYGTPGTVQRLEVYARGLSDALNFLV